MRRNDVVIYKNVESRFYGRVVRKIGDDSVMWICCGLHIHVTKVDDLEVVDYVGRPEFAPSGTVRYFNRRPDGRLDFSSVKFERPPRFEFMTSLHKLKKSAARYHGKNVWKTPIDYEFIRRTPGNA